MRISVLGAGYVGLVTGACLAEWGNEVSILDLVGKKVRMVNSKRPPFHESGLSGLLEKNVPSRLSATTRPEDLRGSELIFICVGTPSRKDGSIDLSQVGSAAASVSKMLSRGQTVVVKSTVIPGTTDSLVLPILEKSGLKEGRDFGLCVNPEFLREGSAVKDFFEPDRLVVGSRSPSGVKALGKLYSRLECPKLFTDLRTAEMIKYASNAFLATKISFSNETANLCERLGVDVYRVMEGVGMDRRISPHFLRAGAGFGGSCFPKDVRALRAAARSLSSPTPVLDAVLRVNETQPLRMISLAKELLGSLRGKRVAVLGLAFKPDTDDVREAPSLKVIASLLRQGARVRACDPMAKRMKKSLPAKVPVFAEPEKALSGADLCLIVTDWPQFRLGPEKFLALMRTPAVVDGRRLLDPEEMAAAGIKFRSIGWGIK